eukprot:11237792-Prorocentrum_lima.AAC.1
MMWRLYCGLRAACPCWIVRGVVMFVRMLFLLVTRRVSDCVSVVGWACVLPTAVVGSMSALLVVFVVAVLSMSLSVGVP